MITLSKLLHDPFNEWLRDTGFYIALGVAGLLIIIVVVLYILSIKKRH